MVQGQSRPCLLPRTLPFVHSNPHGMVCGQSRSIFFKLDHPSARTRMHDPRAIPSNWSVGLPRTRLSVCPNPHNMVCGQSRPCYQPQTGLSVYPNLQGAVRGKSRLLLTGPYICPLPPRARPSIRPNPARHGAWAVQLGPNRSVCLPEPASMECGQSRPP